MPATYEPIATSTLSGTSGSIVFNSIPQTYTDLKLVFSGSNSEQAYYYIQYNSDSSLIYNLSRYSGNGSSTSGGDTFSIAYNYLNFATIIPANTVCFLTADIFSYTSSFFKTSLNTASTDNNGSGSTERIVGQWKNTSAITSITFSTTNTGNFTGTATLYGIKSA